MEKGDEINIDFVPKEKETTPPKHYTIETLNNYLKNPFKEDKKKEIDEETDEEDYKAIFEGLELGTEATRTGIIDNAKNSRYIELKKDVYTILPDGEYLINQLLQMGISMDKYKTATIGQALKKVYRNTMKIQEAVTLAEEEINMVFKTKQKPPEESTETGMYLDRIGICPQCGSNVIKGKYNYGCLGYKTGCKFRIPFVLCKRVISIDNAKLLITQGRTSRIRGFISKNGKEFEAYLILDNGNIKFDFF